MLDAWLFDEDAIVAWPSEVWVIAKEARKQGREDKRKMSYCDKSICHVILVVLWSTEMSMGRELMSSGGESTFAA